MSTPHPLERQVGGSHYQGHEIQPIAAAMGNRLTAAAALALKHVTRPEKGQLRQDIEKCLHYLDFHAQRWEPVDAQKFADGLAPEVPAWMRRVAWHIVMMDHPMADRSQHRADARRHLQAALQRMDEEAGR